MHGDYLWLDLGQLEMQRKDKQMRGFQVPAKLVTEMYVCKSNKWGRTWLIINKVTIEWTEESNSQQIERTSSY